MFLDDSELIARTDKNNVLSEIKNLPDQLELGWVFGQQLELAEINSFKNIIFVGSGESDIAANILKTYLDTYCEIPVLAINNLQLPLWVRGKENLVIVSSFSGNSIELKEVSEQAYENNCCTFVITNGEKLFYVEKYADIPVRILPQTINPRNATIFLFTSYLSLINRLGLIPDLYSVIMDVKMSLGQLIEKIDNNIVTSKNPSKRLAIQMINRWITIIGGGYMLPIARFWMIQINKYAKSWAQYGNLPEMNQNLFEELVIPDNLLSQTMVIFLTSSFNHPGIQMLTESTKRSIMIAGIGTDLVEARGDNLLTQIFSNLIMGEFTAYYLAMAYQIDPSVISSDVNFS